MPEVVLEGCTPEPLMSYLKALGVLRLVSEQVDAETRGCWRNEVFVVSGSLDHDGLLKFFLDRYEPTPIVAPWAGGSGFFGKDDHEAVNSLAASNVSRRLQRYPEVIEQVRTILREEDIINKPKDAEKEWLLRRYRAELPSPMVEWMDAAMVLQDHGQTYTPLLGTGGNDGRLDFTQNFMRRIVDLKLHQKAPCQHADCWLEQALFAKPLSGLLNRSVGQCAPGRAGGPNATQGMEGNPSDNPWDFVLMMEGSLCLAGAAVRRLGITGESRGSIPFTVRPSPVGCPSTAEADVMPSRGELWLPVWGRPARLSEVRLLFGEGRAVIGRRPASNGVEFARAVAGLGVDRGICQFVRLGFLRRNGKAYLAVSLGRIDVPRQPRSEVALLQEIDPWLDRFRIASGSNSPPRLVAALRAIDRAVFDFSRYGGKRLFQAVLVALGRAERELALSAGKIGKGTIRPLSALSPEWVAESDDNSTEFAIAQALAGMYDQQRKIGPLRSHLEPVDWRKACRAWAEKDRSVVWTSANFETNLASVLARRLLDGQKAACDTSPLASTSFASSEAIADFLVGKTDDRKLEDLLWGLILVRQERPIEQPARTESFRLPRAYALLKLLFLPWPLSFGGTEYDIRPEPAILSLLAADRVGDACRKAVRRLRASRLVPMPCARSGSASRDRDWDDASFPNVSGPRLAAALLIPVSKHAVAQLARLVLRPSQPDQDTFPLSNFQGDSRP